MSQTRRTTILARLSELRAEAFTENCALSDTRQRAIKDGAPNVSTKKLRRPVYIHQIDRLGPEGKKVWRHWNEQMGNAGAADIAQAKAWFLELYNAGSNKKTIPYHPGGAPLHADERRANDAGKNDADKPPPTKRHPSQTPIADEIVALERELETLR